MTRRQMTLSLLAGALAPAGALLGQRPAAAQSRTHRLAARADALRSQTANFLDWLVRDLHHQHNHRREGAREIEAIGAAGNVLGQARAFRELLEVHGPHADFPLAWRSLVRQIDQADRALERAHVQPHVYRRWDSVLDFAEAIDREMGRSMRRRRR